MNEKLKSAEWILVGSLMLVLGSLFLIAEARSAQLGVAVQQPPKMIELEISGAVKRPGTYSLECGALLKNFLKKAGPKKFADLAALNLDEPVFKTRKILIDELQEFPVTIDGPLRDIQVIYVLRGTRVSELKTRVTLNQEEDPGVFKSKRILSPGEKIYVDRRKGI